MNKLTDELLVAYMDGELSPEDRASVRNALRHDADARARLEAFERVSTLLRASPPPVVVAAPAPDGAAIARKPRWRFAKAGFASACVAGLLWAGTGFLDQGIDVSRSRMLHEIAEHFVQDEASEQIGPATGQPLSYEAGSAWLSRQFGTPLDVPLLPGWAFAGGQLLRSGPPPVVELVYSAPGRRPIAICITLSGQADRPPASTVIHGLRVADWDQQGYFLALLGQISGREMDELSSHVRKDLAMRHTGPTGSTPRNGFERHGTATDLPIRSSAVQEGEAAWARRLPPQAIRIARLSGGAAAGTMIRAV